jgi:hypothetical protein
LAVHGVAVGMDVIQADDNGSGADVEAAESLARPASNNLFLLLYAQTFLASFGERMWGFAVPMLLATMYPKICGPQQPLR